MPEAITLGPLLLPTRILQLVLGYLLAGWLDAVLDRYADAVLLFGLMWHGFAAAVFSELIVMN